MSDEDDQSDNERVGSSEYPVGYKKPPPQHRFQKGRSGNPRGRPRQRGKRADAIVLDAQALMLHEAYRLVSIREGDRIVKMPAIQAVMRGLGVAAIKGNPRAQLAFKEITESIEAKLHADKLALFEAVSEYKLEWETEFEKCDRNNLPRPDPVPHPDDIRIDTKTGQVRFIGPFDDITKKKWDRVHVRKKESLQEIDELRKVLKREPDLRTVIEREIGYEQRLVAMIDYYLPDEATRRSPFYDPEKIKKPDFLRRMPRGRPTILTTGSGAAAGRRR